MLKAKIFICFVVVIMTCQLCIANPIPEPFIMEFSTDPPWIEVCAYESMTGAEFRTLEGWISIISGEPNGDCIVLLDSSNTSGFILDPEGDSIIFDIPYGFGEKVGYGIYGNLAGTPPPGASIVVGMYSVGYPDPYDYELFYNFCLSPTPGQMDDFMYMEFLWGCSNLIINEISSNNTSPNSNYIELYNAGDSPVCTDNLKLISNAIYSFSPPWLTIFPGEYYVVEEDDFPSGFTLNTSQDVVYLAAEYDDYRQLYAVVDQVGWSSNHGENISFIRYPDGDVNFYNWLDFMGYNDQTSYTFENGYPTRGMPNDPVGIEENKIPIHFSSLACYPNPFNAQARISFTLVKDSYIKLSIYDITGRLVDIISEGRFSAGEHTMIWDASEKPSGMYFAHLDNSQSSITRKLVLLK